MSASSGARAESALYARGLSRYLNYGAKVKKRAIWMAVTGTLALAFHMASLRAWDMTVLIKTAIPGTMPANSDIVLSLAISLFGLLVVILGLVTFILLGSILIKIIEINVGIADHLNRRS